MRRIWQELLRYQALHGADEGPEWMKQELLWREFFLWSEQHHGAAFHAPGCIQNRRPEWVADRERFARWTRADSGHPLIDADPALNTGNWAYLAGVGSDPRSFGGTPRRFDLARQVDLYDPHETHRQQWS